VLYVDNGSILDYSVVTMITPWSFLEESVSRAGPRIILWVKNRDPRIVRLRELPSTDASPMPRRVVIGLLIGGLLAIGAVAVGATRDRVGGETVPIQTAQPGPVRRDPTAGSAAPLRQKTVKGPVAKPISHKKEVAEPLPPKPLHPRFFDPVYVFSPEPISHASAYPLANPPGLVVDLSGVGEPAGTPGQFVGADDRIQSVRRRVTPRGVRYIIILSTPLSRIETFQDGDVVMIFPRLE